MTSDVNDLAVSAITIKTFAASNSPEHRVAAKTQNAFKRAELIHFKRQRQQELWYQFKCFFKAYIWFQFAKANSFPVEHLNCLIVVDDY